MLNCNNCNCNCCRPDEIYFQKEMDYDDIKNDFKRFLLDNKVDLRKSTFNFPLLMYYLVEMTSKIFSDLEDEKYKYDTKDKSTTVISENKLNILLYDTVVFEKDMEINKKTNEDYNLLHELVETQCFQKYIYKNTRYRIKENALRHITDLVINQLKLYMDKHAIKKISVYDKSDRENMKLITVFVRPSYLNESN